MAPKEPSAREMLKALETMLNVLDFFGVGTGVGGSGTRLAMMAVALVGVVILFGVLAAVSLIVVALGLTEGPYAWLGAALMWAAFFGGLAAFGILVLRFTRRHRRIAAIAGFTNEPDDARDGSPSPILVAIAARRRDISASRLRDLDANLARSATPAPAPAEPDPDERTPGPSSPS
jgi:hypothetical protein